MLHGFSRLSAANLFQIEQCKALTHCVIIQHVNDRPVAAQCLAVRRPRAALRMHQMPATNVNRCGERKKNDPSSDAIVYTHP